MKRCLIKLFIYTIVIAAPLCGSVVRADTLLNMYYLFSGDNIYSPSVLYDNSIYKIWYTGIAQYEGINDNRMFYRSSTDNIIWSEPVTILNPPAVDPGAVCVADPSVTKHIDSESGQPQYTMFYTLCMESCHPPNNQIWSAVSSDGITWGNHKRMLSSPLGSSEPSAMLVENSTDGTFWKVYYVDQVEPTMVKMVQVDSNRDVIALKTVYTHDKTIANPEMKKINDMWFLFFNEYIGYPLKEVRLCQSVSFEDDSWYGYQILIDSGYSTTCANDTPGVLAYGNNKYDLFFAEAQTDPDGDCDLTKRNAIHRWTWLNEKCYATFDTSTGVLNVPSFAAEGKTYSAELTVSESSESQFSLALTNIGAATCSSSGAYYDLVANVLQLNLIKYEETVLWARFSSSIDDEGRLIFTMTEAGAYAEEEEE